MAGHVERQKWWKRAPAASPARGADRRWKPCRTCMPRLSSTPCIRTRPSQQPPLTGAVLAQIVPSRHKMSRVRIRSRSAAGAQCAGLLTRRRQHGSEVQTVHVRQHATAVCSNADSIVLHNGNICMHQGACWCADAVTGDCCRRMALPARQAQCLCSRAFSSGWLKEESTMVCRRWRPSPSR